MGWMNNITWRSLAPAMAAALLLCGCGGGVQTGGGPALLTLDIPTFSYAPATPARVGDTLVFTAFVRQPQLVSVEVLVTGESNYPLLTVLHDDGVAPDAAAGDRVYSGAAWWNPDLGSGIMAVSLTVQALVGGQLAEDKRLAPWLEVLP